MKDRYVIGIDPSGNFYEGKGTTGIAVYDRETDKITRTAYIQAQKYETQVDFWDGVVKVIQVLLNRECGYNAVLSIEDYLLYSGRAESQTNSTFETPQLIGVLKYQFRDMDIYIRPAVRVKKRWSDKILLLKKYLYKDNKGGYYFINEEGERVLAIEHCRDAIRHAIHCGKFEIDKKGKR